ncbi:MAG: Hsp70 suppressor, GTPase facilitates ribosomal subunit dissociation [Pleopsidium flavum]|nr:MAG: Hsp70 suppressor, GTPase facilitates ribosomal subunit dissociation [Pleopsidium flavum]
MSRHKLVKTMDLEDEMDDFDGGDDYDYNAGVDVDGEEDLSAEDKEQLRDGTIKVRDALGSDIVVTDKEIQDSLWHYYYDIGKTITWILSKNPEGTEVLTHVHDDLDQRTASQPKKSKKHTGHTSATPEKKVNGSTCCYPIPFPSVPCSGSFSAAEFFQDSPWLNLPIQRRGEILIEPLYPRIRLLGGASTTADGKVSKLAALAAARKKKETDKAGDVASKQQSSSVALLDKLSSRGKTEAKEDIRSSTVAGSANEYIGAGVENDIRRRVTRKYPARRGKSPSPSREIPREVSEPAESKLQQMPSPSILQATPSMFAKTMLGGQATGPVPGSLNTVFKLPYFTDPNFTESGAFTGPSPDDIVSNAQAKGLKGNKSTKTQTNGDKSTNQVTNGLNRLVLEEQPRSKSKNLDVITEYKKLKRKKAANFVVIGHVDAGKSTLMGRLLYDLKLVDQRTIDKYRKEADKIGKSSFALAWVLDQGTEERIRGVTIDIATNKFETEETSFTILDAPGHRDFIPNMIAGASQADFAVLVIDASTGSFESGLRGQTKEHALLVRSMGVQRIIVAVNKLDTVQWSKDRFEEIEQQILAFLTISGFQAKNISFVPCSGLTGDNIVKRAPEGTASWYTGPTLIQQLENSEPATRALEKALRMTVSDIFRGGLQNPFSVSGRVDSGSLQVGDQIIAMPSGEKAYIKGIEVDQEPNDWAIAGQNVTLHLTDIDSIHVKTGDVLCDPLSPIKNITSFRTKILAFDHITPMQVDVHRGRLHAPGRITQLLVTLDKASGAVLKKKPRLIQPGSVARILVEMDTAVPLEAPGRVVLRANGATVAAGLLE